MKSKVLAIMFLFSVPLLLSQSNRGTSKKLQEKTEITVDTIEFKIDRSLIDSFYEVKSKSDILQIRTEYKLDVLQQQQYKLVNLIKKHNNANIKKANNSFTTADK